ncbi:MAG: DUF4276 family protein [Cetobacterium sp.]|uniref:DUF4276 family protein n=1 Tax=Cetobacterium sp. TaxID=2071632 RepID=UPI003F2E050D
MQNIDEIDTKKMCIFVEGQTEQIFIKKLLEEIISLKNLTVILSTARGGQRTGRISTLDENIKSKKRYFVQIVDSGNESSVLTDILENEEKLRNANFIKILGIRDLYPKGMPDYERLCNGVNKVIRNLNTDIKVHIVIKEIETWFLKEYTHLERLDTRLTLEHLKSLNFNLDKDMLESDEKYNHPAGVLNKIYESISKNYSKKKHRIERLVSELDYAKIYLELRKELRSLDELLVELDMFFT